jgi:hypothetical protein
VAYTHPSTLKVRVFLKKYWVRLVVATIALGFLIYLGILYFIPSGPGASSQAGAGTTEQRTVTTKVSIKNEAASDTTVESEAEAESSTDESEPRVITARLPEFVDIATKATPIELPATIHVNDAIPFRDWGKYRFRYETLPYPPPGETNLILLEFYDSNGQIIGTDEYPRPPHPKGMEPSAENVDPEGKERRNYFGGEVYSVKVTAKKAPPKGGTYKLFCALQLKEEFKRGGVTKR